MTPYRGFERREKGGVEHVRYILVYRIIGELRSLAFSHTHTFSSIAKQGFLGVWKINGFFSLQESG
jgi:hypothetical protein